MGILKKSLLCMIALAAVLCCRGEEFTALEDEDAGQLVYHKRDASVYVFRKRVERRWEGLLFKGGTRRLLVPGDCILLDFTEKTLTPEGIAVSLIYWTGCPDGKAEANAYRFLARRVSSPLTNSLTAYYSALEKLRRQLNYIQRTALRGRARKHLAKSRRAEHKIVDDSDEETAEEKITILAEKNPCRNAIETLIRKNHDVFSGTVLFLEYRAMFLGACVGLDESLREQVRKELGGTEEELLKEFGRQQANGRKRENDFRKLCPDRHGRWEYASPGDLSGMLDRVNSCFRAFRTVWQSSRENEFPAWGNAMLEILQMVGSPDLEKQFDEAYSAYRKRLNGAGGN